MFILLVIHVVARIKLKVHSHEEQELVIEAENRFDKRTDLVLLFLGILLLISVIITAIIQGSGLDVFDLILRSGTAVAFIIAMCIKLKKNRKQE